MGTVRALGGLRLCSGDRSQQPPHQHFGNHGRKHGTPFRRSDIADPTAGDTPPVCKHLRNQSSSKG
jgi:hypothetical protein